MIVLDASVVVDVLVGAPGAAPIRDRIGAGPLAAPDVVQTEIVSALRGLVLGGQLGAARAVDALADFEALAVEIYPVGHGLRLRAFALRDTLTAHDATFVALAEALDCVLLTRDARLVRAAGQLAQVELI